MILNVGSAMGQKYLSVDFTEYEGKPPSTKLPKAFDDSLAVQQYLLSLRFELIEEGYIAASVDNVAWRGDSAYAEVSVGNAFQWAALKKGNVREEFLSKVGFRERFFLETDFRPREVSRLIESLLDYAEEHGYPFAQLALDSILIQPDAISAVLNMQLNSYTVIDSLIIKGDLQTNRRVIENHIGIAPKSPYNQKLLSRIPNRLRELPYVKVIKPYEVGMREGKADVYLYLDEKKASNFDGVLGVLPDPVTGEVLITGDVSLDLMNALKRGEAINLRWQRLQTRTQQLDLRFNYPFVFNSPIGTELKMNLFRQDTIFSQVNLHGALQYYFMGGKHIKIFVEDFQANVISPTAYQQGRFVDSRTTSIGLGVMTNTLDYRFNPRSGYYIEAEVSAGTKRIERNSAVDDSFYEGLRMRSELYNARAEVGYHQPIGKRSTVLFRVRSGYFLNENMFLNEAFRIGGLRSIRGFDEQAIFATGFAIGTMEYRFLLDENSNIFLFLDQGVYENRIAADFETDTPIGFGGGINFETAAGIFSLTYALGRQFDNQIQLRGGKLHFGFVSFF